MDTIYHELGTSSIGLSHHDLAEKEKLFGKNILTEKKKTSLFLEFLSHFKSPLIIILLIAAAVSELFGETADAVLIFSLILFSVVLDFFLEHSAESSSEKLREKLKTMVHVQRDDQKKDITMEEIYPGDIIYLSAGSLVPADARIISAKDFFVNQSALTGESFPSEKSSSKIEKKELSLVDLKNIVLMGTNVVSGSAAAVVLKTGKMTEYGKIANRLAASSPETAFEKGIKSFGYLIMKSTFFLVLFVFLFNSLIKHNIFQSFIFAIAVAVGLTPELLPMIMSVTMARGSINMAKKGVIVKKLSSIPDFGSMDVLCTDKTGTLTEDKIKLVKYTDVQGKDSDNVLLLAYLNSLYQTGIPNPLDRAVLDFKKNASAEGYSKVDEIPFDFARKKMSVVVEKDGKRIIITKGAPEEIYRSSDEYYEEAVKKKLDKDSVEKITKEYHLLSSQGYRVLAVATKEVDNREVYSKKDEEDLDLIGYVAFLDPPKADLKTVLKEIKNAGIEVKVITGDNEIVTRKICSDIGLESKGEILGSEMNSLSDDALKVRVEKATIFARFSPDEKNRIISALRSNGHIVGYLGDGINDAPSLKSADIGISVETAVDVAKESADMVLTRKSLRVLEQGIFEGRKTFGNTLKYIMMGLSSNFGNMFSVAAAVLLLPFLPMLPIQILLVNFIYDFSQITIPGDNVDKEFIEKPKRWDLGFIKKFMFTMGPVSSLFDILTFGILFLIFKYSTAQTAAFFQTGWFIESLATQTLVIHIIRTKHIPFIESNASRSLALSSLLCVAFGWLLPFTPLGAYFGLVVLPLPVLLSIAGLVIIYLVVVQIVKSLFYKKNEF